MYIYTNENIINQSQHEKSPFSIRHQYDDDKQEREYKTNNTKKENKRTTVYRWSICLIFSRMHKVRLTLQGLRIIQAKS